MSLVRRGRWITLVALVLLAGVYVRALAFTPIERLQGPAQKIFYLHVPAAIWAEMAMVFVGLASVFYLFRTLHPQPIILKPSGPSLPDSMLVTWLFSLLAFTLLYVGFVTQRYAVSLARDARETAAAQHG